MERDDANRLWDEPNLPAEDDPKNDGRSSLPAPGGLGDGAGEKETGEREDAEISDGEKAIVHVRSE